MRISAMGKTEAAEYASWLALPRGSGVCDCVKCFREVYRWYR